MEKIIEVSQKIVEKDEADSLFLSCMSMGFLNVADETSNVLNIPVINPSKVALKITESLLGSGLMHSKKAFVVPPKLSSGKINNIDQLYIKK